MVQKLALNRDPTPEIGRGMREIVRLVSFNPAAIDSNVLFFAKNRIRGLAVLDVENSIIFE